MRFSIILLIALSLQWPCPITAQKLSRQECLALVKDLEQMSNLNPGSVEAKAPEVLIKLKDGESPSSYFIAYNIYAENLFNEGKIDKAHSEIEKMLQESADQDNVESKVIALRAKGQFYYKLGLYERAAECFRQAMEMCPRYDSDALDSYFTWSSTLFWLVQADLRTGRLEEAADWMKRMDSMMVWLEKQGVKDEVGYKPVMIRGLKAKIALANNDISGAQALLDECPGYIKPDVPSRAYVEYYAAKMALLVKQNKHEEALPLLDELIDMHMADYKPIAADYLYQKGLSLAELGRYEESTRALREYIDMRGSINDLAMAQQVDELNTLYEVEKLQHERDNMRRTLFAVLALCIALVLIIVLVIVSQRRLSKKNKALAHHISELNRLDERPTSPKENDEDNEEARAELLETGKRIVEFINDTKCYLRADCNRETIKDGLGVSERVMAKAIVAATGLSFVNYINKLRLKVSIEMLEEKPEMTIKDISTACGFGTVRQFQRIFKQHYELSPSAYREARNSTDY